MDFLVLEDMTLAYICTPFSSLLFELETCRTAWFWEQRDCIWYAYDHIMDALDIFRYVTWYVLDIVGICWMCPLKRSTVWTHLQDLGLAPEETHAGWAIHLVTWVTKEKWIENDRNGTCEQKLNSQVEKTWSPKNNSKYQKYQLWHRDIKDSFTTLFMKVKVIWG